MNPKLFFTAAAAAAAFSGCAYRYGDATLRRNPDTLGIRADPLVFRAVPLDAPATHTLHVRNLPLAIYPTHIRVPLTPAEAESKENFPWRDARVRVELKTPEGKTFFSNEVSLAQSWRGTLPSATQELQVQIRETDARPWRAPSNLPHHTSYDAVVTVLAPSKNPKHRAILHANTYVR